MMLLQNWSSALHFPPPPPPPTLLPKNPNTKYGYNSISLKPPKQISFYSPSSLSLSTFVCLRVGPDLIAELAQNKVLSFIFLNIRICVCVSVCFFLYLVFIWLLLEYPTHFYGEFVN